MLQERRIHWLCLLLVGVGFLWGAGICLAESSASKPAAAEKLRVVTDYGQLPLHFIENQGQVDSRVRYYIHQGGGTVFFTNREVVLALPQAKQDRGASRQARKPALIRVQPLGAKQPEVAALEPLPGKVNYYIGNDPHKWRTDIPTYGAVVYREVYEGIDLKYYGRGRQLEYDIIVRPGADPEQVRFAFQGVKQVKLTPAGDLALVLPDGGTLIQKKPVIYQEVAGQRVPVAGRYRLNRRGAQVTCSFAVAAYDRSQPLVIDPVLIYSTYLGGANNDSGNGIAVDANRCAYIVGNTEVIDEHGFPNATVFVKKLSAEGQTLIYSVYLGGSNNDYGNDIAVDISGAAYITGKTNSANFPVQSAFQGNLAGSYDAFVTKLGPTGGIVYSTFLGGSEEEVGLGIALDADKAAYITGGTDSGNFPVQEALQPTKAGNRDAFITKLGPNGNALIYSTYWGGDGYDIGTDLVVDQNGAVYFTGQTASADFPLQGALQTVKRGSYDAFVTKINATGSAPVYSTYLGGSANEAGYGIAVDNTGSAYITGYTNSTDFPLHQALQTSNAGLNDVFVTKLSPTGASLIFSTYLGGSDYDSGSAITVDATGAAYITGETQSINFPQYRSLQNTFGGWADAFVCKLNPAGSSLAYATYLGGNGLDHGNALALDATGAVYLTGETLSSNFPTQKPLEPSLKGISDAFVTKISPAEAPLPPLPLLLLE